MEKKITCNILTPDSIIYEGEADLAVVPAVDGEMGFLYSHAPLISELGVGEIRLQNGEDREYLFVDGGFVEIKDNIMTILAENASKKDDIPKEENEHKLDELISIKKPIDYEERSKIEMSIKRLKASLKVASR